MIKDYRSHKEEAVRELKNKKSVKDLYLTVKDLMDIGNFDGCKGILDAIKQERPQFTYLLT